MKHLKYIILFSILLTSITTLCTSATAQEKDKRPGVEIHNFGEGLRIGDMAIGTDIEERKPVDAGDRFPAGVGRLVCWMSILNMDDPTQVTVVWRLDGNEVKRHTLDVGTSKRWRVWSRQKAWKRGTWSCEILGDGDKVMAIAKAKVE